MNRSRVTGDLASHGNIFVDIANDRVGIGSTIPGEKLSLPDSAKIALGNSADLQISHDGSHSFIQNTTGLLVLQDTSGIYLRSDDIRFQSDGGSETYATLTKNGAVSLNFDNNNRFQTKDYGVEVIGTTDTDGLVVSGVSTFSGIVAAGVGSTAITLDNSHKMTFGSAHELEMFHDGSNSYIKQRYLAYPSHLNIISENSQLNLMSGSGGNAHGGYENAITCHNNGAVKLYYGGMGPHLETYGAGVIVQGNIQLGDKLIHHGDTNTCVRFPATDTISFETAGNERLRITSGGEVGIGTDAPAGGSSLHINGGGASDKPHIRLTADRGLIARLGDTSGGAQAMFDLYDPSDGSTQIVRLISGGGDNYINTGGNFGIGTNSPGSLFQVGTDTSGKLTFDGTNTLAITGPEGGAARIDLIADQGDDAGDKWRITNTSGNEFKIQRTTSHTDTFVIDASGEVGINEASPDRELVVRGSTNSTIKIKAANTGTSQLFFSDTDAENPARISLFHGTGQSTSGHLLFDVGGNTVLTLKSDQNILHTKASSNPNFTLSRNASIGNDNQTIGVIDFASNTAHTVQARIMAKNHGTSNVGGYLVVETRAEGGSLTEKLQIAGSGQVSVINAEVDIQSSAAYTTHLNYNNTGSHYISMANGGATYFRGSNNGVTALTVNGGGGISVTGAISASGNVSAAAGAFTGNIDLNSDTNKLKIGAGDDFQLYHNGSNNFIETNVGDIRIKTSAGSGSITFTTGGSTERWRFTSGGDFVPAANDTYDIGSTSAVVRNIFTGDLHLNNLSKEKGNDVDGTNGSWTIQEGQDDLYIINKLNGKKYRIPLEEIN